MIITACVSFAPPPPPVDPGGGGGAWYGGGGRCGGDTNRLLLETLEMLAREGVPMGTAAAAAAAAGSTDREDWLDVLEWKADE